MVKLRVAARVVAENDYNDAQSSPRSERKFLVVVRNPEDWLIGQLAVEIQNTYKRIYKHDLGRVKYLKDADDFDLDPEQLVADVFVNEGKAGQDGFDQEATIKVIQEQGQAVRHGSVVPDLTPVHYQKRPLPPVPRFSEVPTTLGKRSHDLANGRNTPDHRNGGKRGRLAEIGETEERDELIASVERSPELIEDTQTSSADTRVSKIKLESPEAQRSFRNKPVFVPATEDELQVLQDAPPNFPNNRRNYVLGGEHVTPTSNGITKNAARRLSAANRQSQPPITPPTDPVTSGRASRGSGVNGRRHGSKSPATGLSSTSTKFKSARMNLYDVPESDIEDSQMSPRAQQPLPVPRLVRRMSSIDEMPSQQESSCDTFDAQPAWDLMDLDEEANTNEAFIAEKRHSVSMHNDFRNNASKVNEAARDGPDDETDIPATASSRPAKPSQSTHKVSQESTSAGEKAKFTDSQPAKSDVPVTTVPEARPKSAGNDHSKSQAPSEALMSTPNQKKRNKRRQRARQNKQLENESAASVTSHMETSNAAGNDSVGNEASTPGGTKRDIFQEIKKRRRSSELDSPGEQLSQQLQESARKKSFSEISAQLADSQKPDHGRPSTGINGSASTDTSSRRSSLSKIGSSPGRLGLGITNSPRKLKEPRDAGQEEKTAEPTLAEKLKKAKEDAGAEEKSRQKKGKQKKSIGDPKDKMEPVEEAVLPSVERPLKMSGRRARLVEDLDKQCAVTKPDGSQCGRALDCDVHGKPAKRAVAGRSHPFDVLLDAYKQQKGKDKPKDAAAKTPLLKQVSDDIPAAADKSPAPTEARSSQPKASSATPVLPPGMTPDEYARMMEANKGMSFVPKKQRAGKDSTPVALVLVPEIKSAAKAQKPKQSKTSTEVARPTARAPEIKVTADVTDGTSSSSDTSASTEEESDSEKAAAQEEKSKSKTPSAKKKTKPEAKAKNPALIRESTTPGSDFEAIIAKLRSTPMGESDKWATLKPPGLRRATSSSDRRSSAASSELPKSETNKAAPLLALPSASKPKPTKTALPKTDESTKQATQQAKATPKPAAVAGSATSSSVNKKAAVNNTSPRPAAPVSTLKQLHRKLQQESRQASNAASPAPATSKKIFDDDSDESSSSSESSSGESESESESSGSAAKKPKVKAKKSVAAGRGIMPDPSIRDSSPDEESASASDED